MSKSEFIVERGSELWLRSISNCSARSTSSLSLFYICLVVFIHKLLSSITFNLIFRLYQTIGQKRKKQRVDWTQSCVRWRHCDGQKCRRKSGKAGEGHREERWCWWRDGQDYSGSIEIRPFYFDFLPRFISQCAHHLLWHIKFLRLLNPNVSLKLL